MKLKVVIVDLELSPRAKRLALRFGVPAVILGIATVAYANVPITFTANTTLHAADLNTNFSALDARITALETSVAGLNRNPVSPHFAGIVYNGTTQTVFNSSANIPNAPGESTAIVVTRTMAGGYNVNWVGASFPNGATVSFSVLQTGYTTNVTGFGESLGTTATDGIYLETLKSGVLTDVFFSVTVIGQ